MSRFSNVSMKRVDIQSKPWRAIRFNGNVFASQMEPGQQATKFPTPLPILNRMNGVMDVTYRGEPNNADNTVAIATLRQDGPLWHDFDIGQLPVWINYLGLGVSDGNGGNDLSNDAYSIQFRDTMMESISAAYATQLTQLAFMEEFIETDLPYLTGASPDALISGQIGYTVWYQSFVQNVAAVFGKRNTLLGLQDYLVSEGFNREAPFVTRLFNLLKKQNIYTLFDQIGVIMQGEYFDLDWYREITLLNTLPSRKAKDPLNAMLTILGVHDMPLVSVWADAAHNDLIFSTDPAVDASTPWANFTINFADGGSQTFATITDLFQFIMDLLDPYTVMNWARDTVNGVAAITDTDYANRLRDCMRYLISFCSKFKVANQDFKTFLMVLQDRTAFNRWVLGVPVVSASKPVAQFEPQYVKMIHDIFSALGVAGPMILDSETKAWKVFSMWDSSEGVPAYDVQDGGFPIAASVRGIPTAGVSDFTGPEYMMPIIFSWTKIQTDTGVYSKAARFLNRLGATAVVYPTRLSAAQIATNNIFAGLNLIESSDLAMDVPTVSLGTTLATTKDYSAVARLLATLYGVGRIIDTNVTPNTTNDLIDPSIIGFVGREFTRFSEDSLNYITNRAPFRQSAGDVSIGFALR